MSPQLTDRLIVTGPGQKSPADLLTPIYQAALKLAHEQVDKLPQLRDQGIISELAYMMVDAELMAQIRFFNDQLVAHGVPVLEPVR